MARADFFGDYVVQQVLADATSPERGGPWGQPPGAHGGLLWFNPASEDPYTNYAVRERIFNQVRATMPQWYDALLAGAKGGDPHLSLSGEGYYATLTNNAPEDNSDMVQFLGITGAMAAFVAAGVAGISAAAANSGVTTAQATAPAAASIESGIVAGSGIDASLGADLAAGWEGAVATSAAQNAALASGAAVAPGASQLVNGFLDGAAKAAKGLAATAASAIVSALGGSAAQPEQAPPGVLDPAAPPQLGDLVPWLLLGGAAYLLTRN